MKQTAWQSQDWQARDLRERITIESKNADTPSLGVRAEGYSAIANGTNVPAAVRYVTRVDVVDGVRVEGRQRIELVMRNEFTITGNHRILYDGDYWYVEGFPKTIGLRRRFLSIEAKRADQ